DLGAGRQAGDRRGRGGGRPLLDGDRRRPAGDLLAYPEVVVGVARHLRQVGDGEDLAAVGQALELLAEGRGLGAADPGVHLVEDEGRAPRLALAARRELEGEVDARELAPRGDARERPRLLARVGGEEE